MAGGVNSDASGAANKTMSRMGLRTIVPLTRRAAERSCMIVNALVVAYKVSLIVDVNRIDADRNDVSSLLTAATGITVPPRTGNSYSDRLAT